MTGELLPGGVLPGVPEDELPPEDAKRVEAAVDRAVTMHECSQCGLLHTGREREPMTVDTLIAQNHQLRESNDHLRHRNEKLERSLVEFEARLEAALAEAEKRRKKAAAKRKRRAAFEKVLAKVPNVPPVKADEKLPRKKAKPKGRKRR